MLERLDIALPPQSRDDPDASYLVPLPSSSPCDDAEPPGFDPQDLRLLEDTEWMQAGLCHPTNRPDHIPQQAWFASRARLIEVDGIKMRGYKLVASALAFCRDCPAQYDCFEFAVLTEADVGTWGVELDDLNRWRLRSAEERHTMVERARHTMTPIQVAVKGQR